MLFSQTIPVMFEFICLISGQTVTQIVQIWIFSDYIL